MYKSLIIIFCFLFSYQAIAGKKENDVIAGCATTTGGEPTATAICAGKILTSSEIDKCLSGSSDCFGKNNFFRQTFGSLFGDKKKKKSCGNYEIYTKINGNVEFAPGKLWRLCSGYKVWFQKDGNLVVYNPSDKAVWSSNTHNKGADQLSMQSDGNLVIYKRPIPLWASNTSGNPNSFLAVQEDGNLVIYNSSKKPIWATGTNGK